MMLSWTRCCLARAQMQWQMTHMHNDMHVNACIYLYACLHMHIFFCLLRTQMQWQDDEIHWFSIVNSSVILLFLSGMVAMIMLRILRKDLYRYNQLEQSEEAREEAREETGWKLISGDVFRPPKYAALLAVYVGSGVQVTTHPSIQHTLIPACVHTYTHTHTQGWYTSYEGREHLRNVISRRPFRVGTTPWASKHHPRTNPKL